MKKTQRYERRLEVARTDCKEVMLTYKREIELQKARQRTKNRFIWICAQQEIDQLKAEKDAIEEEVVG